LMNTAMGGGTATKESNRCHPSENRRDRWENVRIRVGWYYTKVMFVSRTDSTDSFTHRHRSFSGHLRNEWATPSRNRFWAMLYRQYRQFYPSSQFFQRTFANRGATPSRNRFWAMLYRTPADGRTHEVLFGPRGRQSHKISVDGELLQIPPTCV
jgi:hypothetical protein